MTSKNQPNQQAKTYLTVKQFAQKHQAFTENSLRWLIFNRTTNGFSSCFVKLGKKRVLVDELAFFEKIDRDRMGANI
jgi:hypothetical protein